MPQVFQCVKTQRSVQCTKAGTGGLNPSLIAKFPYYLCSLQIPYLQPTMVTILLHKDGVQLHMRHAQNQIYNWRIGYSKVQPVAVSVLPDMPSNRPLLWGLGFVSALQTVSSTVIMKAHTAHKKILFIINIIRISSSIVDAYFVSSKVSLSK